MVRPQGRERFIPACTISSAATRRSTAPPCSACATQDFGEIRHQDGISPAWPLGYDVFEPYYAEAEALFHVHGQRGEDPNEPWSSGPFPYPPVSHEPRIEALAASFRRDGLHPFHLPLGILLDEKDGSATTYQPLHPLRRLRRLSLPLNGKADAQVDLRRPDAGARIRQRHAADRAPMSARWRPMPPAAASAACR